MKTYTKDSLPNFKPFKHNDNEGLKPANRCYKSVSIQTGCSEIFRQKHKLSGKPSNLCVLSEKNPTTSWVLIHR